MKAHYKQTIKPINGYYNDNDIKILYEAYLNRYIGQKNIKKIGLLKDADDNSFVASIYSETSKKLPKTSIILPPIIVNEENNKERVIQLKKDFAAAYLAKINQILIPMNMLNFHWYTLQISVYYDDKINKHSATKLRIKPVVERINVVVHDSLFKRTEEDLKKTSRYLDNIILDAFQIDISKFFISKSVIPQIQDGNTYCGGYTARLIANLVKNPNSVSYKTWGCGINHDDYILRQEDVKIVLEHNIDKANGFGAESLNNMNLIKISQNANINRDYLAKSKMKKILIGIKENEQKIPLKTREYIKNLKIPKNAKEVFALTKSLYFKLPGLLNPLFQDTSINTLDNLKITTDITVENIIDILHQLQKGFSGSFSNSYSVSYSSISQKKSNNIAGDNTNKLPRIIRQKNYLELPKVAKPDSYPNDLIHGFLAEHSYRKTLNKGSKVGFNKQSTLYRKFADEQKLDINQYLSQWEIQDIIKDKKTGYLGVLYKNDIEHQVILAHRGTLTSELHPSIQTDIESVLQGKIVNHQKHAYSATKKAVEYAKALNFILSITGHSLGAWLAALSVFFCNTNNKIQYRNVKAVTFDGPGSYEMIKKMSSSRIFGTANNVDPDKLKLDITSYFSAPNLVNCCNKHIATKTYRIFPKFKNGIPWWIFKSMKMVSKKDANLLVTLDGHAMKYILPYFDSKTGTPKNCKEVISWPSIIHKEFGQLSDAGKEATVLGSLLYFVGDVLKGKINREQFWEVSRYLDESNGYAASVTNDLDEFQLLYKGQYNVIDVNRHSRIRKNGDGIDDYLAKLKQNEHKVSFLKNPFSIEVKSFITKYSYSYHQSKYIFKTDKMTIAKLRDTMRIFLYKYQSEIDYLINYKEIKKKIAPYFGTAMKFLGGFIGRDKEIDIIKESLKTNDIVIIKGVPGIGKTSTAYHCAKSILEYTPIWFYADSQETFETSYRNFANSLGLNLEQQEASTVLMAMNNKLLHVEQKLLFILDNVEGNYIEDYINNLPTTKNIKLLITTRNQNILDHLKRIANQKSFTDIELKYFDINTAIRYLANNGIDKQSANLLMKDLGTIPQHLSLAVGYLNDNKDKTVLNVRDALKDKTIFEIIINELIAKKKLTSWKILQYISWLNPEFIPAEILSKLVGKNWQNIMKSLKILSLVEIYDTGVKIHRETQDQIVKYSIAHPSKSEDSSQLLLALFKAIDELVPSIDYNPDEKWQQADRYRSNIQQLFKYIEVRKMNLKEDSHIANLHDKLAKIYRQQLLDFEKALSHANKGLEIRKFFDTKDSSSDIAKSFLEIGDIYSALEKFQEARKYYKLAYKYMSNMDKEDHPDIAKSLHKIGGAEYSLKFFKEALENYQKSLNMYQKLNIFPEIAKSLRKIGVVFLELKFSNKALQYFEDALQIQQNFYKQREHTDIADTLNSIACAYFDLGAITISFDYCDQALSMYKSIYGDSHPTVAHALNNIGVIYQKLGKYQEALTKREESLKMYKDNYADIHPEIARVLAHMAGVYQTIGKYQEALDKSKESLKMYKAIYKKSHHKVAEALGDMAFYHHSFGNHKEALAKREESLKIYKDIYEDSHHEIARTLGDIAASYIHLGKYKEALAKRKESLDMYKAIYSTNHLKVAQALHNMASTYTKLGKHKQAFAKMDESLRIYRTIYKDNHPEVAGAVGDMASYHHNLGEHKKALIKREESLKIYKNIYGNSHPDVARTLDNIAYTYQHLGNYKEALAKRKKSLEMYQVIYDDSHHKVASTLDGIADIYTNLGKYDEALQKREESLEMYKEIYRDNHPNVASILMDIAFVYVDLGYYDKVPKRKNENYNKALQKGQESLNIYQEIYSDLHPKVALALINLATVHKNLKNNDEALRLYRKSLKIYKEIYGDDHSQIAFILRNIAYIHMQQKEYAQALEKGQKSLEMYKKIYGEVHLEVAQTLMTISTIYTAETGKDLQSLQKKEESLDMYKKIYGHTHLKVVRVLDSIVDTYNKLGRYEEALEKKKEILKLYKLIYKENHFDIVDSLNSIGVIHEKLGREGLGHKGLEHKNLALYYFKEAFEASQLLHKGNNNGYTAMCLRHIGNLHLDLNRIDDALNYYKKALMMGQALYKEDHPDLAIFLEHVGLAYCRKNSFKIALHKYYRPALKMQQALHKEDHPEILRLLGRVAEGYFTLNDFSNSLYYYEQRLKMAISLHGKYHSETIRWLNNVGILHAKLGDMGKYYLYKRQALCPRDFIIKRGVVDKNTIQVKYKIQKTLNKIQKLSATGTWSYQYATKIYDWGVRGYLEKSHLKKKLSNLYNPANYKIALGLCFEAINIGGCEHNNFVCTRKFVLVFFNSVTSIAQQHPEYCIVPWIEDLCLRFRGSGILSTKGNYLYDEYYNTGIDLILKLRFKNLKLDFSQNVKILKAHYFGEESNNLDPLLANLNTVFLNSNLKKIFVPFNLYNKHWVGLLFYKINPDLIKIIYMDSEQKQMPFNLKLELNNAFSSKIKYSELSLEKQKYNTCGFEVIENFKYFLTGTRATQKSAPVLHSLLWENSLLDKEQYQLKIAENNDLIKLLSGDITWVKAIFPKAPPIQTVKNDMQVVLSKDVLKESVNLEFNLEDLFYFSFKSTADWFNSLDLFLKQIIYKKDFKRFKEIIKKYNIKIPESVPFTDILMDKNLFNKKIIASTHPDKNGNSKESNEDTIFVNELKSKFNKPIKKELDKQIDKVNQIFYKVTIKLQEIDCMVDLAKFVYEPTYSNFIDSLECYSHLYTMQGMSGYSILSGGKAFYQIYQGEYQEGFNTLSELFKSIVFSYLIHANPYIGLPFGMYMSFSKGYHVFDNIYSFSLKLIAENKFELLNLKIDDFESYETGKSNIINEDQCLIKNGIIGDELGDLCKYNEFS